MSSVEFLDRHQFPPQAFIDRDEDAIAVVPVPHKIFRLPIEVRAASDIVSSIIPNVADAYNEDMKYYLDVLKPYGGVREFPALKGYEEFRGDWNLEGAPDVHGCLELNWFEDDSVQTIKLADEFHTLYNQTGEDGRYYSPQSVMNGRLIEIAYRPKDHPDIMWVQPEGMEQFGQVSAQGNVVTAGAFTYRSETYDNLAKTLLLRNFTVAYLNLLIERLADLPKSSDSEQLLPDSP